MKTQSNRRVNGDAPMTRIGDQRRRNGRPL